MDPGNENLLKVDYTQNDASQNRRASQGLPPDFVRKMILSSIFRSDYKDIDFRQALTGLDYLRDLEETRRCCLRETATRLGITVDNWRDVLAVNVVALEWVEEVLRNETVVEAYYARIYVNIRIWVSKLWTTRFRSTDKLQTMVHELNQPSFYKPNVLAMLNTLFPPSIEELPNSRIPASVLHKHRASLYHYMLAVESGKHQPLNAFVAKHLRIGTSYSWPETRLQLEKYTELADSMIRQARSVHGVEYFQPHPAPRPRTSISDDLKLNLRSTPLATPRTSFGGVISLLGTPIVSSATKSLRARGHTRYKSRTIIQHEPHLEESKTLRSAPLVSKTSDLRRPTTNTPETIPLHKTSLSNDSTLGTSTQSSSPARRVSYSSQRGNPFDSTPPEFNNFRNGGYPDIDSLVEATLPLMSGPIDPAGLDHQYAQSSSKSRFSHSVAGSMDSRGQFLRRNSSALRNMELPSDNLEFLNRPFEEMPQSSPNLSPPKLNQKSNFGDPFLRKAKSTTSMKDTRSTFKENDVSRTPSMHQRTPNLHEMHSTNSSGATLFLTSRDASFDGRSISTSHPSTSRGNPLGIYGASMERFPSFDEYSGLGVNLSPSKVVTPLEEYNDFTGIQPEFTPRSTPRLSKHSSFAHLARPSTSSGSLGRRERAYVPPSPHERIDTRLPFERFPGSNEDLVMKQKPELKKQRSFGFLETTKSNTGSGKQKIRKPPPSPTPLPISAFATGSPFIGLDATTKVALKRKSSMPTMGFLSKKPKEQGEDTRYFETNDPNERLIITRTFTPTARSFTPVSFSKAFSPSTILRPFTPAPSTKSVSASTIGKRLRLAKSEASLKTIAQKTYLATPHKLFKKFSRERVLSSADTSEPHPLPLQNTISNHHSHILHTRSMPNLLASLPPYAPGGTKQLTQNYIPPTTETLEEFKRKEYTRRWFLEESRARKYDLNKPLGSPLKTDEDIKRERKQERIDRLLRRETKEEMPRATRKKLERPVESGGLDGLFERVVRKKGAKGEKKLKYKTLEVERYDRY